MAVAAVEPVRAVVRQRRLRWRVGSNSIIGLVLRPERAGTGGFDLDLELTLILSVSVSVTVTVQVRLESEPETQF